MSGDDKSPEDKEGADTNSAADPSSSEPAATIAISQRDKVARIALVVGGLAVALIGVVMLGLFFYARGEFRETGQTSTDQIFLLAHGTGLNATAAQLEANDLISNGLIFRLALQLSGEGRSLKAGEYLIPAAASMEDVAVILADGKSIQHRLTVAEGLTSWEVVQLITADPVLIGEVPPVPAEGSLLPETYHFTRGTNRTDIIAQMVRAHEEVITRLWDTRAENLPITTMEEAVILASIVEKETGLATERPRVAAVFVNRLHRGMRLQSDPTIIYGLTDGKGPLGHPIRRSELDRQTDYNTYQINGLPPTPIANPGEASLAAVLNPPETKELYFVADGTGGHTFAETLRQHQQNVAKWRRIERTRRQ